jgi:hypothetical protein
VVFRQAPRLFALPWLALQTIMGRAVESFISNDSGY